MTEIEKADFAAKMKAADERRAALAAHYKAIFTPALMKLARADERRYMARQRPRWIDARELEMEGYWP